MHKTFLFLFLLLLYIYLFIWIYQVSLPYSIWDLSSQARNQNIHPLHCKGFLTSGSPEESPKVFDFDVVQLICFTCCLCFWHHVLSFTEADLPLGSCEVKGYL